MKNFKVYLNRTGIINVCKGNLAFKPLMVSLPNAEGYYEVTAGLETLNYEELHYFMENNPEILIENNILKDSEGNIYGGIVLN